MERMLGSRMTSINGMNYEIIQICSINKLEAKNATGYGVWAR